MERLLAPGIDTLLFLIISFFWWAEFIIFGKNKPKKESSVQRGHKTFNFILAAILIPLILAFVLYFGGIGNLAPPFANFSRGLGIILYTTGIILRYWALILLGSNFVRNVSVENNQNLVSSGPYHLLRHPSYTGLLLLNLGLHFFIGNLPSIIVIHIMLPFAIYNRTIEEENVMEEILGRRYVDWKASRKRFIPWLY